MTAATSAASSALVIQDPRSVAPVAAPLLVLEEGLDALIIDRRDRPFLGVLAGMALLLVPSAALMYAPGEFSWFLAAAYLAVLFGLFFDRFILLLHNTRHRRLFRPGLELDWAIDWVFGPLAGQTPWTYHAHHLGMHHVENNLWDDRSSTLPYRRDSLRDFVRYWTRFAAFGITDLALYLRAARRGKLARRVLVGEATYFAALALLLWVDWRATAVVFLAPLAFARFGMMAGNWAQHAFVDPAAPENAYRNSITTINTRYNRRCFNDGYHIGHHLKPSRHWTEMPGELLDNVATYRAQGAIVFQGLDYFQIWALLMVKAHGTLADHVVDLSGGLEPLDRDGRVALLRARLGPVPRPAA